MNVVLIAPESFGVKKLFNTVVLMPRDHRRKYIWRFWDPNHAFSLRCSQDDNFATTQPFRENSGTRTISMIQWILKYYLFFVLVTHTPSSMRDKCVTSRFVKNHLVCSFHFSEKSTHKTYIFYVENPTFVPVLTKLLFGISSKKSFSTFAVAWHVMAHFWSCHAGDLFSISRFLTRY